MNSRNVEGNSGWRKDFCSSFPRGWVTRTKLEILYVGIDETDDLHFLLILYNRFVGSKAKKIQKYLYNTYL